MNWGHGHSSEERPVDVHVRRLREKLETGPGRPQVILTVRGVGYRCGLIGGASAGDDTVASAA